MNPIAQQRYTEIKTALLVHLPFFSSLLFDMMDVDIGKFPHVFGPMTPTAATNGRKIWIDEDFLAGLKLPEAVFLICHEVGHAMWEHMARANQYKHTGLGGAPFNPRLWNMAGDYVINDMLTVSKVGKMPAKGLLDARFKHDMLVEDVYKELLKEQSDKDPGGQDGNGNDGSTLDVHIPAGSQLSQAEVKRAIQTAVEAAKAQGKLPAALERFATELLAPVVRWQDKLRHVVTRAVSREGTTWTRPHRRRLLTQGVYLPTYTGFGAGEIVVVIDTSGSIGDPELTRFLSEVDDITMNCNPERLWLVGCDAAINTTHEIPPGTPLVGSGIKLGGGGGTDFKPPFDWVDEQGLRPAALLYFTDMYGDFPRQEPAYPVIWCRMSEVDPPWGDVVDVKLQEK